MSLVKDLVDLVTQLDHSVADRRILDMVHPIKEKALEVQRENLAIATKLLESDRKTFESEQRHANTIADLKAQCDQTVSNLNEQITQLKLQLDTHPVLHHGLRWDDRLNPHCPVCKSPLQLLDDPRFCHCTKCKQTYQFRTPDGELTLETMQELIRNST